jgi:hypothetical protein
MRITEDRYSRDRQRFDLALRFIRNEARTSTTRVWTGLSDDRIRKLHRTYAVQGVRDPVPRHRGKPPQQISFFLRTAHMRQEATILASVCQLFGVLPSTRMADAVRMLPSIARGEALCEAYETYRRLVPESRISFEHAVFLIVSLASGEELQAGQCVECTGLTVVDRWAPGRRRCLVCERTIGGFQMPE